MATGGGHAFISLHLGNELLRRGHSVTILQDGDQVRATGFAAQALQASGPEQD